MCNSGINNVNYSYAIGVMSLNHLNLFFTFKAKISTARSLGDIAMDLTETVAPRNSKLVSMESKDKLIMASNGSLGSSSKTDLPYLSCCMASLMYSHNEVVCLHSDSADNEVNEELKKEKIAELKNKQKNLEDLLMEKLDELKKICLREAVSGFVTLHRLLQVCVKHTIK